MDSKIVFLFLITLLPAVLAGYPYNCTLFCDNLQSTCTGANQQYPTDGAATPLQLCQQTCLAYNSTNSTSDNDDTYDCHYYHQTVSVTNPNLHCPHAGPLGGQVCGQPQEAYCDLVEYACTGTNLQYTARSYCLAVAQSWSFNETLNGGIPLTPASGASQTTIECHEYHGQVAAQSPSDASVHCPHAGAAGAGVCGSAVENFCALTQFACGAALNTYPQYGGAVGGSGACALLAAAFPSVGPTPVGNVTSGNSLECRNYHAAVAVTVPFPHCYHTGVNGGNGVCGNDCDAYCSLIQHGCNGTNSQYAYPNTSACLTACAGFPTINYYNISNTLTAPPSANTLDCRLYHITVAIATQNPNTHCPHASLAGGGVCVDSSSSSSSTGTSSASSLKVASASMVGIVAASMLFLL